MKNFILIFLLVIIIPIGSCVKEDLNTDLVVDDSAINIPKAPCTFLDTVSTTKEPGLSGELTLDLREGVKADSLYLHVNDTNYFVIVYSGPGGFRNIPNHAIKFNYNPTKVDMLAVLTGKKKKIFEPYDGEMHIYVQADKSVKIDWCDVRIRDANQSYSTTSGGCHLHF